MKVKIINNSNNPNPEYATSGAAGVDLRANEILGVNIGPGQRQIISTGISLQLPEGYEAQIRPRSGLAAKYGITVLNSPGTIDSDYTGEIKVILHNASSQSFEVSNGDRIAQMVIAKYERVEFEQVDVLEETERGSGGFGSTGTN